MATPDGTAPQHLSFLARAAKEARKFGAFALLRGAEARAPKLPRIGSSRNPAQNVVDISQTPVLAFPGATVDKVEVGDTRGQVHGYWFGLTGPMGPLPLHMSEFAAFEHRYSKVRPFGRFLDMLASRMQQLFFRAWADSNPVVQADRPEDDQFAKFLAALTGAGEGASEASAFPARARLYYAGLFASHRTAVGIQDALTDLLGTPVRLMEYQPRWRDIDAEDRSRLGGAFSALGVDAVLGSKMYGVTDAYRVVITARDMREYEAYLPTGRKFRIAAEALDAFSPSHLEWDIELQLAETEARPVRLDGRARLGWTSWMAPGALAEIRGDAHLGRNSRRIAQATRT